MNFLQLYFVNRDHPVRISLNEDSFKLINEKFLAAPDEPIGFVELETFQGQHVWINADRVIIARYLYEPIEREKLEKNLHSNTRKTIQKYLMRIFRGSHDSGSKE